MSLHPRTCYNRAPVTGHPFHASATVRYHYLTHLSKEHLQFPGRTSSGEVVLPDWSTQLGLGEPRVADEFTCLRGDHFRSQCRAYPESASTLSGGRKALPIGSPVPGMLQGSGTPGGRTLTRWTEMSKVSSSLLAGVGRQKDKMPGSNLRAWKER